MASDRLPAGPASLAFRIASSAVFMLLSGIGYSFAAERAPAPQRVPMPVEKRAWLDRDTDGVHDLFRDADGDGVNDRTGAAYAHRFLWLDSDGDGLNDLFRDADGDGVNDLEVAFRDRDGDGRDDNVLDYDADGRNDVTGLAYTRGDLQGNRHGYIAEGDGSVPWVDEDGDGLADDCWFQGEIFHRHGSRGGGSAAGGPRQGRKSGAGGAER